MPEVLNGVAISFCCVTPIWRWHFCFIKLLLVDSFGLRLYHVKRKKEIPASIWILSGHIFCHEVYIHYPKLELEWGSISKVFFAESHRIRILLLNLKFSVLFFKGKSSLNANSLQRFIAVAHNSPLGFKLFANNNRALCCCVQMETTFEGLQAIHSPQNHLKTI